VDAQALADAGAFAVVLEMVPVEVAEVITRELPVPTIGIGAGAGCDGQILVIDDLLGRFQDLSPRFVRRYLDAGALIRDAVDRYAADIAAGAFPDNRAEAFALPDAVRDVWLAETRMDSVSENRAVCG
jgi:3-methyl-2-oxobutanoate hydroxymethyltransferase